ncbi:hypothetical protein HAALTHF_37640n [Vreelandella aquamarina]|nr:hypothetical protein HAALTHF_37640n [Halomonas axialensis]
MKSAYVAEIREEYEKVRERNAKRRPKAADLDYTQARKRRFRTDWANHTPAKPNTLGLMTFDDYDLEELVERIDWTPLLHELAACREVPKNPQ